MNRRLLAGLCVVISLLFVGLLATRSRESWLAAAVTFALLFALAWPRLHKLIRWGVVVIVPLVTVVALVSVPSLRDRIEKTFDPPSPPRYQTGGVRYGLAPQLYPQLLGTQPYDQEPMPEPRPGATAWNGECKSLGAGWGIGEIEEHPQNFGGVTAENVFIQQFAQIGIFETILLIALCAVAIREGIAEFGRGRGRSAGLLFALAFFTAFTVHGIFGNWLGDPTI